MHQKLKKKRKWLHKICFKVYKTIKYNYSSAEKLKETKFFKQNKLP